MSLVSGVRFMMIPWKEWGGCVEAADGHDISNSAAAPWAEEKGMRNKKGCHFLLANVIFLGFFTKVTIPSCMASSGNIKRSSLCITRRLEIWAGKSPRIKRRAIKTYIHLLVPVCDAVVVKIVAIEYEVSHTVRRLFKM